MDTTGGQPTYITLWLSQSDPIIQPSDAKSVLKYNSLSSRQEGAPDRILHEDLALTDMGEGVKGNIFSEDIRLGTIIVSTHGNPDSVMVADRSVRPKELLLYLVRRVREIDPLGVEQVDSITLAACRVGCWRPEQPSFVDRLGWMNFREEPADFPSLKRVAGSPYGVGTERDFSSDNLMALHFLTPRKLSDTGYYYEDIIGAKLDTGRFLRGYGSNVVT